MTDDELDGLAKELRHDWDSPGLWKRIEGELESAGAMAVENRRQRRVRALWAAGAFAASVVLGVLLWYPVRSGKPGETQPAAAAKPAPLLTDQTIADVRAAEAAYRNAIDRLAKAAAPKLEHPTSPLLRAYAERLALLDGAIEELQKESDANQFNAHLRWQMASLYQEKQKTLEGVIRSE